MNSAKKFQYCTSKITFLSLRTKQIVDGWDVKKKNSEYKLWNSDFYLCSDGPNSTKPWNNP